MRTADFSRILFESIQLCGLDRDEISNATFAQIRDLASMRLRFAWEYDTFPQVIRYSEETILTDANDAPYFLLPSDCGEIFNVWEKNPITTTRNAQITFLLTSTNSDDRAYLTVAKEGTVWVEYRTKAPELHGVVWDSTTQFVAGSQTYFDAGAISGTFKPVKGKPYSGNFYKALINNENHKPSEQPNDWAIIKIPHVFATYVTRGVYADYLRSEGQVENAKVAEQEAHAFLDEEIDKIARQQGQTRRINFINPYS